MLYEQVFRGLNEAEVKYLVAGGVAVNLHGAPRFTHDLDLILLLDKSNIEKTIDVLRSLDYEVRLPVDPEGFADEETRESWIKEKDMKAFTFQNKNEQMLSIDLLFGLPLNYEDCYENHVIFEADDLTIPVISKEDLLELKRQSDRVLDQVDIKMLKKLEDFEDET